MRGATTAQRLAEIQLGFPLDDWIDERRSRGESWRMIAGELDEVTGGKVQLHRETLRVWYGHAHEEGGTDG